MTAQPLRGWLAGSLALLMALLLTPWALAAGAPAPRGGEADGAVQRLLLVLPDDPAVDPVAVRAWRDAADELGFVLDTITAAQLQRDGAAQAAQAATAPSTPVPTVAALILPDTIHRRMSDAFIDELRRRLREGTHLMLVHDAGLAGADGHYAAQRSRLSDLAGVDYAVYAELKTGMLRESSVAVLPEQVGALQIPPGKLVRGAKERAHTSDQPAPAAGEALWLASYVYGPLKYMGFVTRGNYAGTRLMSAPDGSLVAGLRRAGTGAAAGQVLFVNLPLTMLKLRTDSLPLHSFLRYFAQQVAGLPQLSPMPQGRGAVVMNWHVDDRKALPALARAAELGAFEQGPYSIHVTAGPDVNEVGDGKGMDLPNNPDAQGWVRRLAAGGHEIGSHGGWIHNWFGMQVGRLDPADAAALIERNSAALRQFSGRPVREYSAPVGNHPRWLSAWLRERGMPSYYFTGDSGMPPTRSYQDGQAPLADVWSFPVLSFGVHASFEEAKADFTPESAVSAWLRDVNHFCADQRTARLVYFHPIGLVMYPQAFRDWLADARRLSAQGRMRWMTMAQFTDFANRRLHARWWLTHPAADGRGRRLLALHPVSLAGMTWLLPRRLYQRPEVTQGRAAVDSVDDQWRVVAGAGDRLELRLGLLPRPDSLANPLASP